MVAKMQFLVYVAMFMCLFFLSSVHAHPLQKITYLEKMPAVCKGKDFCFSNESYPFQLIDDLVKELHLELGNLREALVQRDGVIDGYTTPCENEIFYDKIYAIKESDKRVRFVIQSGKAIEQKLRLEICAHPNERLQRKESDSIFTNSMLAMFNITCQQRTIPYQFVVLNLAGDGFELISVMNELPVACVCMVR